MNSKEFLNYCNKLKENPSLIEPDSLNKMIERLNNNEIDREAFEKQFSNKDYYFDNICPYCYGRTFEKTFGTDGNTFCENCGNIEGQDSPLEIQAYPLFKIMAIYKNKDTKYSLIHDEILFLC